MSEEPLEVLLSEDQIRARVAELAEEISRDYAGKNLLILCVLKGAVVFLADLLRGLSVPAAVDFIAASSYDGGASTGDITLTPVCSTEITAKDVLIVEDIIDTGLTCRALADHLAPLRPASLKLCALLDKPAGRRPGRIKVDYAGFVIPDKFVVGYGLDYREKYRNLPDIRAIAR